MPLEFESYAEPEVAVAAAVGVAAASPSLRHAVRRGVIYGLAGALIAYDRASATAQGIARGIRKGAATVTSESVATPPSPAAPPPPPPAPTM